MTKKKSAKRALLISALSLMLCVSMLVGSTFAWFTDSVTSGSNVIQSGNLDLVVEYTLDGKNWADLQGATNLFQKALWEPGHTEVVALRIKNNGTLALKYVANMNITSETAGKTADNKEIVLSDILTVSTLIQQATEADSTENQVGKITLNLAFSGENSVGYQNTTAFKSGNVLGNDVELQSGAAHYLIVKVDMAETVGNEANHNGTDIPTINFGINVLATQFTSESDSFGNQYDKDAVYPVANAVEFQEALNNSADGDIISFVSDFEGDVTVPQKADTKITIDGNGKKFDGTILVDGKSGTITTAGITIKNVNFTKATADACITLGKEGNSNTRYTCNVTIEDCTFDAPGAVGVKSYTGGDKNLTIKNCTATANAHSLAQLKGIDGVTIENCKVYSKNGINLNNSDKVTIRGCTVDVKGYAVRFGESKGGVGAAETYTIENCTLKSANDENDATIILRGTADNATLTIVNTTIAGNPDIINTATGATVVR